ncbi:MAG: hypothetical protein Q8N05_20330 [Bacteroidota bacterium]|nr:hypothetical protein [Bacteroidota bacterium]
MISSIFYRVDSRILAAMLFIGIIVFYFIGLKVCQYKKKKDSTHESLGIGPFEGAMLGLISLLLAFTFNQSASYYNSRREILMHESNCIGTALLRSDLYPDSVREAFRSDLKEYIPVRIHYYEVDENENEIRASLKMASVISERIWKRAAILAQKNDVVVKSMQMVPAINDMIDAVGAREEARTVHIPESILWLLFTVCLWGSFIVGYASKSKKADWIIICSYSLFTVMTFYVILDLDQPRSGIIDTSSTHQSMHDLMDSFQSNSNMDK